MRKKSAEKSLPRRLIRARAHHKILFSLVGIIGVVLVWRGIWTLTDATPLLNDPIASIALGIFLVILSGFFFKLT
ncbi:MAG: hypothetical protein HY429_01335 [Candidatus Levybacteria bacterium]|nr:hypothetical protein [Candidatus Levybacteria bacterium]